MPRLSSALFIKSAGFPLRRLHLVDINPSVADALRLAFAPWPGVDVQCCDILDVAFDTLVSPANSYGFMDGGIDMHYINVLGPRVQNDVIRAVEMLPGGLLPVGSSIVVPVKHDRIRRLLVAPTMEHPEAVEPRNASRAMAAILRRCKAEAIEDVFCPGLCTLTGRVAPEEAATEMARAYARSVDAPP